MNDKIRVNPAEAAAMRVIRFRVATATLDGVFYANPGEALVFVPAARELVTFREVNGLDEGIHPPGTQAHDFGSAMVLLVGMSAPTRVDSATFYTDAAPDAKNDASVPLWLARKAFGDEVKPALNPLSSEATQLSYMGAMAEGYDAGPPPLNVPVNDETPFGKVAMIVLRDVIDDDKARIAMLSRTDGGYTRIEGFGNARFAVRSDVVIERTPMTEDDIERMTDRTEGKIVVRDVFALDHASFIRSADGDGVMSSTGTFKVLIDASVEKHDEFEWFPLDVLAGWQIPPLEVGTVRDALKHDMQQLDADEQAEVQRLIDEHDEGMAANDRA